MARKNSIIINGTEIDKIWNDNNEINKVYLGNELIWNNNIGKFIITPIDLSGYQFGSKENAGGEDNKIAWDGTNYYIGTKQGVLILDSNYNIAHFENYSEWSSSYMAGVCISNGYVFALNQSSLIRHRIGDPLNSWEIIPGLAEDAEFKSSVVFSYYYVFRDEDDEITCYFWVPEPVYTPTKPAMRFLYSRDVGKYGWSSDDSEIIGTIKTSGNRVFLTKYDSNGCYLVERGTSNSRKVDEVMNNNTFEIVNDEVVFINYSGTKYFHVYNRDNLQSTERQIDLTNIVPNVMATLDTFSDGTILFHTYGKEYYYASINDTLSGIVTKIDYATISTTTRLGHVNGKSFYLDTSTGTLYCIELNPDYSE